MDMPSLYLNVFSIVVPFKVLNLSLIAIWK